MHRFIKLIKLMKRSLCTLFLLLTITIAAIAQSRVTSNKNNHNFGQIQWKEPVTAEYIITNTGDQPLIISNITTSCACSDATWTQTPIAPGEKGKVTVSFDAQALGRFEKSVGIYSNADPALVYLKFSGEVVRQITDFSHTHLHTIGDIRIDSTAFNFPDSHLGDKPTITFSVVNQSDRPYEPVLMHLPGYISMEKSVNVLQKGERGVIKLTLDTDKLSEYGLTKTSVYLSRFTGDKVSSENEIPVSVVLLPDTKTLSAAQRFAAPKIMLSDKQLNFITQLTKKNSGAQDIRITNTGKSPLIIHKLQVFNPAVNVRLKKATLQHGESTTLRITVRKKDRQNSKQPLQVLMITNDPDQPKVVIDIKQ